MTQLDLLNRDGSVNDLARARVDGMAAALEHADDVCHSWSDLAYKYLCNYAARAAAPFTGEDVTAASIEWGLVQPPTTRAWGSLYRRAQRAGVIAWVDNEGRRSNGSPCARYRRG